MLHAHKESAVDEWWERVRTRIKAAVGEVAFQEWLHSLHFERINGSKAHLSVAIPFLVHRAQKYNELILRCIKEEVPHVTLVTFAPRLGGPPPTKPLRPVPHVILGKAASVKRLVVPEQDEAIPTLTEIVSYVAMAYEVRVDQITGCSTLQRITQARRIAIFLCVHVGKGELLPISKLFKRRDASPMRRYLQKVEGLTSSRVEFARKVAEHEAHLRGRVLL